MYAYFDSANIETLIIQHPMYYGIYIFQNRSVKLTIQ